MKIFFYVQEWFDQLLKLYLESDIGSGIKLWYENIRRNAFHCIYFDAIYRKIVDTLFLHQMFLC